MQFLISLTATADGKTPPGSIGTGPFQVNGFNNGMLTLTANENCWQGRPFADAIEIRVHRPVRDQWLDLSVGRADVVEVPGGAVATGAAAEAKRADFAAGDAACASGKRCRCIGQSETARAPLRRLSIVARSTM